MDALKGKRVLDKKDGEKEFDDSNFEFLGIYFSAHWCPPCRGFTPQLVEYYNEIQKKYPGKLEIVFVSSDRDEKDMQKYFEEMPWKAVKFTDNDVIKTLKEKFKVSGIPKLVFLTKDGEKCMDDGRGFVTECGKNPTLPF